MKLRSLGVLCLKLLLAAQCWAQQPAPQETCPHPPGWKPTDRELQRILSDHRQWLAKIGWARYFDERLGELGANLCGADLRSTDLSNAELSRANLKGADLSFANLDKAKLQYADLNGAHLYETNLRNANLTFAKLNRADMSWANLDGASLSRAELNKANIVLGRLNHADLNGASLNEANLKNARLNEADLSYAELNKSNLVGTELNKTSLKGAKLSNADLTFAKLNNADLSDAELYNVNLSNAELNGAFLTGTSVAGAKLASVNLTNATYAPGPAPPSDVAEIRGLTTVMFPAGGETGLVQLRDLLQKSGLRDLEREATFAIENGKTRNSLRDWKDNPTAAAEGMFRYLAFDLTTAYGLRPGRALLLIVALWALLIPLYAWPIWQSKRPPTASRIYRILPQNRVEVRDDQPTLDNPARVERLHGRGFGLLGWSAYFSLLSTFQIGFREFSVGTWLTRAQPRSFALESTGWVRTVSGLQSLLSVYLLAMWVLTYFGRPFQ
jgi:uncharacterized protein YjbI with pentapeptide repeats